ncbi:hypothetical protein IAU59_002977 [Kwoniella sp. CBS 9459]
MHALILCAIMPLILKQTEAHQVPFPSHQQYYATDPYAQGCGEDKFELEWPVKKVAVIGAGVTGMLAYQALSARNAFDTIKVFERDDNPGGNWHYTSEIPLSVPLSMLDSDEWWNADYTPVVPEENMPLNLTYVVGENMTQAEADEKRRKFRVPKPLWKSLRTLLATPAQQIPDYPWPPHTSLRAHHSSVQRYLRSFASWLGINVPDDSPDISYNTRVEAVRKRFDEENEKQVGWTLVLHQYAEVGLGTGMYRESFWEEDFEAIVVATGRFNVPHIPSFPGLSRWQDLFPERIIHSRQYREPQGFNNETVLIVGASDSAGNIAADILKSAHKVYLSVKDARKDEPSRVRREIFNNVMVPNNCTIIGEIQAFRNPTTDSITCNGIAEGKIELLDGSILSGIDRIIFATGYRHAFPFLSQYHSTNQSQDDNELQDPYSHSDKNSTRTQDTKSERPLITDGTHIQSLYMDTFYIDQPTIAFQGQNFNTKLFYYSKYTAEAISRVWAGEAHLPSREIMWNSFWFQVKERGGLGRGLHWLRKVDVANNLRYLVAWLNAAAVNVGPTTKLLDLPPDV